MQISDWYSVHFEDRLQGRYVGPQHLDPILNSYKNDYAISVIGSSEEGRSIYSILIGSGQKKVLAWSQMHGNESTTTKAIFDLLKFLSQKQVFQKEIRDFLANHTLCIIPMLNPDGAALYTRENAGDVDLNRDAMSLSQNESKVLRATFDQFKPDLCFNLHDQRSIYGLDNGKPATISFLAPAADAGRSVTASRQTAMEIIVAMNNGLQSIIPGQVGRYDDTFNDSCVGDTFQMMGVPSILFEAGHFQDDYQRERSREYIFYAFLMAFGLWEDPTTSKLDHRAYFLIPENRKNFTDVLLRNVKIANYDSVVSMAIQYEERLEEGKIEFLPIVDKIGELNDYYGHKSIEVGGTEILMNSHENVFVNDKVVTIVAKNNELLVFFSQS